MSAVSGSETEQALVAPGVKPPLAVPRRLLRMRSDAALAERFAAGDEAAFDVIYERHRPVVLAVCMGVLGTPPDAEDATQETFSALAVALRTRPPAELRPWLIRVARNASIDTTRRRRHRLLTLDGEIPEIAARPHGSGKAELAVVLDGIRELPEGQRMALLMRELGGHSYAEIADFLATDEEAVKGLIARARVGLRSYREATELSCAAARNTIAAEPDGRRYDKTIRRHLRGCSSCRSYRDALRDDAKALRAALPIQAGTVATGSLSGGMLTAAKGSLISYGLTQAATTCAASACAVGAIGGMVFVAPVHKLGLPPILAPSVLSAPAATTPAATKRHHHKLVIHRHAGGTVTVSQSRATAVASSSATSTTKPTITHGAVSHRRRHVHVTRIVLPGLHKHHGHGHGGPGHGGNGNANGTLDQNPATGNGNGDQGNGNPGNGNNPGNGHGNGHAYGSWKSAPQAGTPQTDQTVASGPAAGGSVPDDQSSSAASSQPSTVAQAGHDNGNGNGGNGGHGHGHGNPHYAAATAAIGTAAAASAQPPAATTPSSTVPATTPGTTVTSTTPGTTVTGSSWTGPGHGWGHNKGNQSPATTSSTATPSTPSTTTVSAGASNGNGHGHGWGRSK